MAESWIKATVPGMTATVLSKEIVMRRLWRNYESTRYEIFNWI
jgi:hypothetical protein